MKVKEYIDRTLRRIVLGAIIALPLGVVLYLTVVPIMVVVLSDTDGPRARLLYETDHQALLEACRELSRRAAAGDLKPGEYYVRPDRSPQVVTFPEIILDLEPSAVLVGDYGEITIAMTGGLDHFGVSAYPKGDSSPRAVVGGKRLLEGLWYYDDGYEERPDDWDKHLEKLRPRANQP